MKNSNFIMIKMCSVLFCSLFLIISYSEIYSQNRSSIKDEWQNKYYKRLWKEVAMPLQYGYKNNNDNYFGWDAYPGKLNFVTYNHKGTVFASCGYDGTIRLWDARDNKLIKVLPGPTNDKAWIAFSPNDSKIAYTHYDSKIRLIDILTGNIEKTYEVPYNLEILCYMTFSPDGTKIVSTGCPDFINMWDVSSGNLIASFPEIGIFPPVFSPDGSKLVTLYNKTVTVWDPRDTSKIMTLSGHNSWIYCVKFSPDGSMLASCGTDSTIKFWNMKNGSLIRSITTDSAEIYMLDFSPDGKKLVSCGYYGGLKIWNVTDGSLLFHHPTPLYSVSFSSDGKKIVSNDDWYIKIWNGNTFYILDSLMGHSAQTYAVAYSIDYKNVISCAEYDRLRVWNANNAKCINDFPLYTSGISAQEIITAPDGNTIATISKMGVSILIWNLNDGSLKMRIKGDTDNIQSIAFSPDGSILASAGWEGNIKFWNINDGSLIRTFIKHAGQVNSVSFSPDGAKIASCAEDSTIKIWNVSDGILIKTMTDSQKYLKFINYSPDGKKIASSGWNNMISIWDANTGSLIRTWNTNHSSIIKAQIFSPKGYLTTASWDGTIKIWDLMSGNLLKLINYDLGYPNSIRYNEDGTKLLCGGFGYKDIRIYDININAIIEKNDEYITDYKLYQNYPNPFNSSTIISFQLSGRDVTYNACTLKIYDVLGREIITLIDEKRYVGKYSIEWKPENLSSGIYYYRLSVNDYMESKKLIYLK